MSLHCHNVTKILTEMILMRGYNICFCDNLFEIISNCHQILCHIVNRIRTISPELDGKNLLFCKNFRVV